MENKWSLNGWVTAVNILTVCILFIQISNSQYLCFSSDLQQCEGFMNPNEAQCLGPGSLVGQLTESPTVQLTIYCPWELWQTIKVVALVAVILIIVNWYTLRLILNIRGYVLIFIICLGLTMPLFLASGIMDLVHLSSSECNSAKVKNVTVNEDCERGWFYINAVLEVIGAFLIGIACFFMLKWRKVEEGDGTVQNKYALVE